MALVEAEDADSDLYPVDEQKHRELLTRCQRSFLAADAWKQAHRKKWLRFYKLVSSHVPDRLPGEWDSRVFIPLIFQVIQTILPRLVAQMPKPIVHPVARDDEVGAPQMEELLQWAAGKCHLYEELLEVYWSALVYGTGMLKIQVKRDEYTRRPKVAVTEPHTISLPQIDPGTGQPMTDMNGAPMMTDHVVGERPVLDELGQPKMKVQPETVVSYVGPYPQAVDIFDIFPAPDATSPRDARYLIHRTLRDRAYVEKKIADKDWRVPDHIAGDAIWGSDSAPVAERQGAIGLGGGSNIDDDQPLNTVWECWYREDLVVTILNQRIVVKVAHNPHQHGEFPFIRVVDYFKPFEFWGEGEVHHLEGLQGALNAEWNQRIDNVRLQLNAMFLVDAASLDDYSTLRSRPGGVVPMKNPNGLPLQDVVHRLDFGDVTASAYSEAAELERMAEKVSGVSGIQAGAQQDWMNGTATGAMAMAEQGNQRFSMKAKVAELTGIVELFRQMGSDLQQFMDPSLPMRIIGPDGVIDWQALDPATLYGAFDFDIEGDSSMQTDTIRRDQSLSLLQTLSAVTTTDPSSGLPAPVVDVKALIEDVLLAFGKKDTDRYMFKSPQLSAEAGGMGQPGQQIDPALAAFAPPAQGQGAPAPQTAPVPAPPLTPGMAA